MTTTERIILISVSMLVGAGIFAMGIAVGMSLEEYGFKFLL